MAAIRQPTNEDIKLLINVKTDKPVKRRRLVTLFQAGFPLYALDFSWRLDKPSRIAYTSIIEGSSNIVGINEVDEYTLGVRAIHTLNQPSIATKIQWIPHSSTHNKDMFATSGDLLRIYEVNSDNRTELLAAMATPNEGIPGYAPVTSFDWSKRDPNFIVTASINNFCSIWDIHKERCIMELFVPDAEIFDVKFHGDNQDQIIVGASDGFLKRYDLRQKSFPEPLFRTEALNPILRVCPSPTEKDIVGLVTINTNFVTVVDLCKPNSILTKIHPPQSNAQGIVFKDRLNQKPINTCDFSPLLPRVCAIGGEDASASMWNLDYEQKVNSGVQCVFGMGVQLSFERVDVFDPVQNIKWSNVLKNLVAFTNGSNIHLVRL
ncbi:MAG: putative WD-repeat protein [Streblomastix strix]|uniref:Putative WD-repeat protein n=1 Tax=Streblomastix strix TaxID=222440 RepID=A0A5J4WLU3_9EUKA|nr:MAG: putative WD-repeat protein [Streblomastix strix]